MQKHTSYKQILYSLEKYFRLPIKNSITSSRKSEGANGISLPTFPFDLRFNYRESRRKIAPFCEKIQNTFPLSSCKSRRHFSLKSDLYFSMRFFFRIKSLVLLHIYLLEVIKVLIFSFILQVNSKEHIGGSVMHVMIVRWTFRPLAMTMEWERERP